MIFKEYQATAAAFAVYPPEVEEAYLALGLVGELGELMMAFTLYKDTVISVPENDNARTGAAKDVATELGDVWWYASQLARTWSVDTYPAGAGLPRPNPVNLLALGAYLAQMTKRGLRDAHIESPTWQYHLRAMLTDLELFSKGFGGVQAIWQANLDKLADRQARGVIKGQGDTR